MRKNFLKEPSRFAPDNMDVLFFLGVIYADEGEVEKARLFLSILAEKEKTSLRRQFYMGNFGGV